jgi:hypothetical protein
MGLGQSKMGGGDVNTFESIFAVVVQFWPIFLV